MQVYYENMTLEASEILVGAIRLSFLVLRLGQFRGFRTCHRSP